MMVEHAERYLCEKIPALPGTPVSQPASPVLVWAKENARSEMKRSVLVGIILVVGIVLYIGGPAQAQGITKLRPETVADLMPM